MKTQQKPKKLPRKKTRSSATPRRASSKQNVKLIHASKPLIRHLRLIEHKHTGKVLHVRHTSHLALIIILAFLGFMIVMTQSIARAADGVVTIGVVVPGHAPTIGAVITSPTNSARFTDKKIKVSGTCEAYSFVTISSNSQPIGSTVCTEAGIFTLDVDLFEGTNSLTAQNYDDLNQPGPATPAIVVELDATTSITTPVTIPEATFFIPSAETDATHCRTYQPASVADNQGGDVRVSIVCMPLVIQKDAVNTLGVIVSGGTAPYALNIDWGFDGAHTLKSVPRSGYWPIDFTYTAAGTYKISSTITDSLGKAGSADAAVKVSGQTAATTPVAAIQETIKSSIAWFETPIPLYVSAVAVTAGFWIGDLFDRRFGPRSLQIHRRSRAR